MPRYSYNLPTTPPPAPVLGRKPTVPQVEWEAMMKEARRCQLAWAKDFPVISTVLLRKYWTRATGWEPPLE